MKPRTSEPTSVARLRMDARYHRERFELYRAKTYGPRATSLTRLRELERAYLEVAERLARAEQQQSVPIAPRDSAS